MRVSLSQQQVVKKVRLITNDVLKRRCALITPSVAVLFLSVLFI